MAEQSQPTQATAAGKPADGQAAPAPDEKPAESSSDAHVAAFLDKDWTGRHWSHYVTVSPGSAAQADNAARDRARKRRR
jgi:hypothetical protein